MANNMNDELDFDQLTQVSGGVDFLTPEEKSKIANLSPENQRVMFDFINQERASQEALRQSRTGEEEKGRAR